MTERITPEQATLTPEIIAEIRSLDAQRDPECRWLMQTAEIRWRIERLAANAIIPALDEIERQRKALTVLDSVCGNEIAEEPENLRLFMAMRDIIRAALAPPPAREEGVTTDGHD